MQGFYGSPLPPMFPPVRTVFKSMTAIAIIHTKGGFVVGADGLCKYSNPSETTDEILASETDKQQKIFEGHCRGRHIAYAFTGLLFNLPRTYDLVSHTRNTLASLSNRRFDSFESYLTTLASSAGSAIRDADAAKVIESSGWDNEDPEFAGILVASYAKQLPSLGIIALSNKGSYEIQIFSPPRHNRFWGSDKIVELVDTGNDERLIEYFHPLERSKTIEDAIGLARAFLNACCDRRAVEIDPKCSTIGGHIHIGILSKNGFSWVDPPQL